MKKLPIPAFPKSWTKMAREYHMEVRAFKTKLVQVGIKLARGKIMPEDQLRIYRELGAPLSVWEDPRTPVPFLDTE